MSMVDRAQAEVAERRVLLADRLERARLRRSGLPAGFLVFLVLAFLLFRDEAWELARGTASFTWVMAFGAGSLVGLTLNEITARRSIGELEKELRRLEAFSPPENLKGPP